MPLNRIPEIDAQRYTILRKDSSNAARAYIKTFSFWIKASFLFGILPEPDSF
jgi:hypothetical protein